jgi:integrase
MLVLLDGGARSRPRSHRTIYVYFNEVRPLIDGWSARRGHIREVTTEDIRSGLGHLSGWPLCNATMAVRSLFGFAKRQGLIFANPAQRLMIALAAVHAARWAAIRVLTLDDIDLPNRRITIAGHSQRLGDLSHQALRAWLDHRRATWPHTPNKHVLISQRTALGTDPVSGAFLTWNLGRHGISIERIRRDRVLHEALTARADPLHLAMVFGISQTAASDYALIARSILADAPITTQEVPSDQPVRCRAAGRRLAPPGRGCSGAGRQTRDPSWPV